MSIDLSSLPDEVCALIAAQAGTIARQQAELDGQQAQIAVLRAQLAKLRRLQFGRSSEKLDAAIAQLELALEDLEEETGAKASRHSPALADSDTGKPRPARRPLPAHLPRDLILHAAACVCPACGGTLRPLGEDITPSGGSATGCFAVGSRRGDSAGLCAGIVSDDPPRAAEVLLPGLRSHYPGTRT